MKNIVFAVAFCAAVASAQADVTFTGGSGGTSRDLSLASNWSKTPTVSDVATVDCSKYGESYTMSGDLAIKGLVFSNTKVKKTTKSVTVTGTGTLSLGASGITFPSAAKKFTLATPVALTAAQTWTLSSTPTDFKSSVSGTADWTVSATGLLRIYRLGYGGFVEYSMGTTGKVRFLGSTDWAAKVRLTSPSGYYPNAQGVLAVTNTVHWSDIITGADHTMELSGGGLLLICPPSADDAGTTGQPGHLIFEDGDAILSTDESLERMKNVFIAQEIFDQRGGTIVGCDRYQPMVGANSTTYYYNKLNKSPGTRYLMAGGLYSSSFLTLAGGTPTADTDDAVRFIQTGGTVSIGNGVWLVPTDYSPGVRGISEYILGGGVLNVGHVPYGGYNDAQSRDFILAGTHTIASGAWRTAPAGVLTVTNGTLKTRYVKFGVDETAAYSGKYRNGDDFGLFDMRGGSWPLNEAIDGTAYSVLGFETSAVWNRDDDTRSCYRINLGGGTVSVTTGDWTNRFGLFFPPLSAAGAQDPFTWDTGAGDTDFIAPLSGEGTLRKAGDGKLTIYDASRFVGTLDVAEGEVKLPGTIGADDLAYDCYRWTADSLAGTAEGTTIGRWTDANKGLAATTNTMVGESRVWALPTYVSSSDSFNGHAVLSFKAAPDWTSTNMPASLAVPSVSNPLANRKTATIAAVFRRTGTRQDGPNAWAASCVCGMGGQWGGTVIRFGDKAYDNAGHANPYTFLGLSDSTGKTRTDDSECTIVGESVDAIGPNAPCHVMVATLDNGVFSMFSDGEYASHSNAIWHAKSALSSNRNFFFGGNCYDGVGNGGADCEIAEVRIYPDRVLSLAEQRQLGSHLYAKYRSSVGGETREDAWHGVYCGAIETNGETVPERPEGGTSWDAETLNDLSAATGCEHPTLIDRAIGGHSALHFDGNDALAIPADDSPLSGATAFTMAIVFRTAEDRATGLDTETGAVGLLSSRCTSAVDVYGWDALLGLYRECSVGYDIGNKDQGYRTLRVDRRPCRLNDGNAHVAILSTTPSGAASTGVMVDGRYNVTQTTVDGLPSAFWTIGQTHDSCDVNVGVASAEGKQGFFSGDIAEVVLYGKQLSEDEMTALSANLAAKYRFRLLPTGKFADADVTARGLKATNIVVRAGARMAVPISATDAFELEDATLAGSGDLLGSYRFGSDATLDLSVLTPTALTDAQVRDGSTIRLDVTKPPFEFEDFSASGIVTLDLVNYDAKSGGRLTLCTFRNTPTIAEGTVWKVKGMRNCVVRVVNGKLVMTVRSGFAFILRRKEK